MPARVVNRDEVKYVEWKIRKEGSVGSTDESWGGCRDDCHLFCATELGICLVDRIYGNGERKDMAIAHLIFWQVSLLLLYVVCFKTYLFCFEIQFLL